MKILEDRLLKITDLKIEFRSDEGISKVLDGVSLEIMKGKIVGLVGETGCGKSVTGHAILGLIPRPPGRIVGGEVLFKGKDLLLTKREELRRIRGKEIAMIFQDPFGCLNPVYTVGDQIAEAIELHQSVTRKEALKRAAKMMEVVNIPDPFKRINDYPHQFSGGMRTRVMIAMALSCNPALLIADEPTTGLDVTIQAQMLDLIMSLNEKSNAAVLFISHDLGIISSICDEVVVMYSGSIMEVGKAENFFTDPRHPYSVALIKCMPRLGERRRMLRLIEGTLPNLLSPPSGCRFHPRCSDATARCEKEKPVLVEIDEGHKVACFKVAG